MERQFERQSNVALCRQVVDLVGLNLLENLLQVRRVGQVPVEKILVRLADARSPGRDRSVNAIAFGEKQLGQIMAVLAADAGDEGAFGGGLEIARGRGIEE